MGDNDAKQKIIRPDWEKSGSHSPWNYNPATRKISIFNGATVSLELDLQAHLIAKIQNPDQVVGTREKDDLLRAALKPALKLPAPLQEKALGVLFANSVAQTETAPLPPKRPERVKPQKPKEETPIPEAPKPKQKKESSKRKPRIIPTIIHRDILPSASPDILNQKTTHVGPWLYVQETDRIFFQQDEIHLSPQLHKILKTIIRHSPRPVSNQMMEKALFGTEEGDRHSTIQSTYDRLLAALNLIDEDLPYYLSEMRDLRGFRIASNKSLMISTSDNAIHYGPWIYDHESDYLFYNGKRLNVQPNIRAVLVELIKNYPFPVDANDLADEVYGEDGQKIRDGSITNQNIDDLIRHYNKDFARKRKSIEPVWYCPAQKAYVLNVEMDQISEDLKEEMAMMSFGPIEISLLQSRAWVDKKPIPNLGLLSMSGLRYLMESEDEFIGAKEMGAMMYGEDSEAARKRAGLVIRGLRKIIDNLSPGTGTRMIRAHFHAGYVLCHEEGDFERAVVTWHRGDITDEPAAPSP